MKKLIFIIVAFLMAGCAQRENVADAYGSFEADEVTAPALASGQILSLNLNEGDRLEQGKQVGLIDTFALYLNKRSLQANYQALLARKPGIHSQAAVLIEQRNNTKRELARFEKLATEGAATQKQVDDLRDRVRVLERQIDNVLTQNDPLRSELEALDAQIEQINRRIEDSRIVAPITGITLVKLAEAKEWAHVGSPIFRIANLDTLTLKAYISGSQLDDIRIGQKARVRIDSDRKAYHDYEGMVTWISGAAEFTPKMIQTKEERADLVYAVKIVVPNPDGRIKIGMPGEAYFINDTTD